MTVTRTAMRRAPTAAIGAAALLVSFADCGDEVVNAIGAGAGTAQDGGGGGGGGGNDASFIGPDGATQEGGVGFCKGSGATIPLPIGQCTGDLGPKLFRFAMCSCTSSSVSGKLVTDSFTSGADAGASGKGAASVAANGSVSTNAHTVIGGSIYAGGAGLAASVPAVSLRSDGTIALDVRAGGDVTCGGIYQVSGDLYANGNVDVTSGSLAAVGKVHVSPGHTATGVSAGGGVVTETVTVAPPCDCAKPLDIAGIVAAFKSSNDDAQAGVTASSLHNPSAAIALPCGRYYFDDVAGGDVTLSLSGRTAIFVGANIDVMGAFTVDLAPGAELDLFAAGNFSLTGSAMFGSSSTPSHVRVYSGGPTFDVSGTVSVGANIYAPNADVAVASNFEMWGAFYAKSVAFSGDFTIHYDESVLQVVGCQPAGGTCSSCDDCAGATPACIGGTCQACVTDSDCCAPLACSAGRCLSRVY